MDDSCAVCADSLEWVAYGSCAHREVCSTCVVRLRVVLEDRRCCICKTESPTVFVTKALGDYTRVITDFSQFPANANEGRVGSYWYHEGSQAYFDDVEHYRMIKAMCRLSCSICDKNADEQGSESTKRRSKFRHIDQLKGHLYHHHRMVMCSLCLEGRKVFIYEQKLYTQSQLRQHIHTGDSEVDGSESERGGFTGHPMCEFCRDPFYGDNELYMHMSTEHYTCHICQRQHPGQYDYFRKYDDLETHFRQEHFLCEDEACLAKKFIVFQTEAEMKRHNTIEHGGHMSRSKRNAALQIPTSFRYRRSNDQDQRRGRGRGFRTDPSNNQLSMAIQASLESAAADGRARESSSVQSGGDFGETSQANRASGSLETFTVNPHADAPPSSSAANIQSSKNAIILEESSFPPLADRELPEPSVRYAQALNHGSAAKLAEELFPPLPGAKESSKPKPGVDGLGNSTLASRLNRKKGTVKVLNPPRPGPSDGHELGPSNSVNFPQLRPIQSQGPTPSTSSNSKPHAAISQVARASTSARANGFVSPASANSSWGSASGNKMRHSSSAPNLVPIVNSLPATAGKQVLPYDKQSLPGMEDVQTRNKELIERVRIGLGNDEERYAAFKSITAEYRQDIINTWEYISYVEQFGLKHLMLEIAWLCPDPQKQQELIDAYNANFRNQGLKENGGTDAGSSNGSKHRKKKGEGKAVDHSDDANRKTDLLDPFLDQVRKLQLNQKHQEENQVEVLSKDGYRGAKSITNPSSASGNPAGSSSGSGGPLINGAISIQNLVSGDGDGKSSKQRKKKIPKFNRIRLGEDSPAAQLAIAHTNASPERTAGESSTRPSEALPVRGVWKNKGGQQLFQK